MRTIDENIIQSYQNHIYIQEKSKNTIDKYIRDIRTFTAWLETQEQKDITKKVHIKMQKLNVNMLALVFLFKDIEKISRKLYNNRDKKGEHCYGKWNIYRNKKKNTG